MVSMTIHLFVECTVERCLNCSTDVAKCDQCEQRNKYNTTTFKCERKSDVDFGNSLIFYTISCLRDYDNCMNSINQIETACRCRGKGPQGGASVAFDSLN